MKNRHLHLSMALFVLAYFVTTNAWAAFPYKVPLKDTVGSVIAQKGGRVDLPISFSRFRQVVTPNKHSSSGGALAYLSVICGVVGIAIASVNTVFFVLLLGLLAGVFGAVGLKKCRRNKFHKALCYIGIVLGAILVLFGTVPLLFIA